jgi:phospholipid/cholesterol/gamma-HCH transport system permease protein
MDKQSDMGESPGTIQFSRPDKETLLVHLIGTWKIGQELPSADEVILQAGMQSETRVIRFEHSQLDSWDSSLLTFLINMRERCGFSGFLMEFDGLPQGVAGLMRLASEFNASERIPVERIRKTFLQSVGSRALNFAWDSYHVFGFLKEAFLAFLNFFRGKARYRGSDLVLMIYECGAQALPIVSLISVLVGLILGFVGIVQLRMFGAQIYIANLVGISMAREMGAMMTAIIMMGRTGAAYATQLGTMEANEEIDALKTLGINPMEFLVMPRILALILMMPLLCIYADMVGILGGAFVGVGMSDIPAAQYYEQTRSAVHLTQFSIGVIKSMIFAILIALSGCFHGMHSDRSASAVGYAATRAVVVGIVLIVVADGIFAVITSILKI